MSLAGYSFVPSDELETPPMVNGVGGDERRELMLSDRKASKILGVTVLRGPRPTTVQRASEILGTNVGNWETRVNGGFVGPRNRLRKKSLIAKVAPLILGGLAERERAPGKGGQRVVLSPRWKSSWMLRRHTISHESGLDLLLPSAASSPTSMTVALSPTSPTFGQLLPGGGEEGSDSSLVSDIAPGYSGSETAVLVDIGAVPSPVPASRPPSPTSPLKPFSPHEVPTSPTTRRNPVLERRREMIRSANKSAQILGIEARRAILNKMEKENAGRIGWSGV